MATATLTAEQWKRITLWGECPACVTDPYGVCAPCDERAVIALLDRESVRTHP